MVQMTFQAVDDKSADIYSGSMMAQHGVSQIVQSRINTHESDRSLLEFHAWSDCESMDNCEPQSSTISVEQNLMHSVYAHESDTEIQTGHSERSQIIPTTSPPLPTPA